MEHPQENASAEPTAEQAPALLTPVEARVLGCLVEKQAITPDVYPLTLNALQAACNQKTSREPVMQLEQGQIGHTLRQLESRRLVEESRNSQRVVRFEHRFDRELELTPRKQAVVCALMLRGPATLRELHTRCERLAAFPSVDDVTDTVERLIEREPPLVVKLGRQPGQREERYAHLLCGPVDESLLASASSAESTPARGNSALDARLSELEAEVEKLRAAVAALGGRLD